MNDRVFIEEQFPVSKVSKESYKERKAVAGQTLTGLGKWWGRKPLILVRAAIIGMLMPASADSKKDRDIFLKILTMDEHGLWHRRSKSIPTNVLQHYLTEYEWAELSLDNEGEPKRIWSTGLSTEEKDVVLRKVFECMSYDEKLTYCDRQASEQSAFEQVINRAVEIASDHLVPKGLERRYWKILSAPERLYLKGLELEKHLEARSGAYQELAKGFGVRDYTSLFQKATANAVRFKTGTEFKKTGLGSGEFGSTTLRNLLFAISETVRTEDARQGLNWLREEVPDYWDKRKMIIAVFNYLAGMAHIAHMIHWEKDADAAQRLAGAVENDHEGRL